MFFGDSRTQGAFNANVQQRLREREASERHYAKDQLHQQRLAFMRSGIISALQSAPVGLFADGFALDAAAEAAVRAGTRGA